MADDIVERLRIDCECYDSDTCVHAAARDEIEQLRAEIERLRAAGDLLAAYVVLNVPPTAMCFAAVERWQKARRG